MTIVVQTFLFPDGLILLLLLCILINLGLNQTTATKKTFLSPLMLLTMTPIVD